MTVLTVGFPLTLVIHFLIAIGMAVVITVTGLVARLSLMGGVIIGVFLNGLFLPALFIPIPHFG